MQTVEDVNNRIVICDECVLPLEMGKVDVLVPILNLDGQEEDLLLDLHYSLYEAKTWKFNEVVALVSEILRKIQIHKDFVALEASERLPDMGPNLASSWILGFEMIRDYAVKGDTIYWKRKYFAPESK